MPHSVCGLAHEASQFSFACGDRHEQSQHPKGFLGGVFHSSDLNPDELK